MDTDGYTPTIDLEKLLHLARKYGPSTLGDANQASDKRAADEVRQVICPCVQGDACVCEALAEEFDRLTAIFRGQVDALKPKS